jgi:hypothetical protein
MLRVYDQIVGTDAYFEDSAQGLKDAIAFLHKRALVIQESMSGYASSQYETISVDRVRPGMILWCDDSDGSKTAVDTPETVYELWINKDKIEEG